MALFKRTILPRSWPSQELAAAECVSRKIHHMSRWSFSEVQQATGAQAVTSNPALRELPGSRHIVTIDEVLEALSALDHGPKEPPGGKPARTKSTARVGMAAENVGRRNDDRRKACAFANAPQQHQPLLNTRLTDCESQFIEKRLSEERSAMERLAASTFPLTPQPIVIEMRRRVRGISERKKIKFTSGH
jgi:hypothetical protein